MIYGAVACCSTARACIRVGVLCKVCARNEALESLQSAKQRAPTRAHTRVHGACAARSLSSWAIRAAVLAWRACTPAAFIGGLLAARSTSSKEVLQVLS